MSGLTLNRSRQAPAEETPAFGSIAERFRRAGDLDRAIALCHEGLRKFPHQLSARVTLGWALLDKGHYDAAQAELEQVLRRAPDNLAAIRGLAELHDRAESAVPTMEQAGHWQQAAAAQETASARSAAAAPAPSPVYEVAAPDFETAEPVAESPAIFVAAEAAIAPMPLDAVADAVASFDVDLAAVSDASTDLIVEPGPETWEAETPLVLETAAQAAVEHAARQFDPAPQFSGIEDAFAAPVAAFDAGPAVDLAVDLSSPADVTLSADLDPAALALPADLAVPVELMSGFDTEAIADLGGDAVDLASQFVQAETPSDAPALVGTDLAEMLAELDFGSEPVTAAEAAPLLALTEPDVALELVSSELAVAAALDAAATDVLPSVPLNLVAETTEPLEPSTAPVALEREAEDLVAPNAPAAHASETPVAVGPAGHVDRQHADLSPTVGLIEMPAATDGPAANGVAAFVRMTGAPAPAPRPGLAALERLLRQVEARRMQLAESVA